MNYSDGKPQSRIWRWWCSGALLLLLPGIARSQDGVRVAFDFPRTTVSANEPVYLELSVYNGLQEAIRFDLGPDRERNLEVSVLRSDGSTVPVAPPTARSLRRAGNAGVAPGQTYTQKILLNKRLQFTTPGDYRLRIRLTSPIETASGRVIESPAQDLKVGVTTRDPQRLADVCKTLANTSSGYSDYATLSEAATALSYVEDPVAISYLQQVVAEHNFVSEIAVKGLVRIGSPEALRALESELDTPDKMLKMKIQGAIQEIKTGIHPQVMD